MNAGKECRIVLTRTLPGPVIELFHNSCPCLVNPDERTWSREEILRQVREHATDALLVMAMDRIDAGLIEALPDTVRVIATFSVGHDHIDLGSAGARHRRAVHARRAQRRNGGPGHAAPAWRGPARP